MLIRLWRYIGPASATKLPQVMKWIIEERMRKKLSGAVHVPVPPPHNNNNNKLHTIFTFIHIHISYVIIPFYDILTVKIPIIIIIWSSRGNFVIVLCASSIGIHEKCTHCQTARRSRGREYAINERTYRARRQFIIFCCCLFYLYYVFVDTSVVCGGSVRSNR